MRWLRTFAKIVASGALAIVVLAVATIAALQLHPVQRWLVAKINQSAAGEAHLAGFSGTIPTDMKAATIELDDPAGRWAVVHDAVLRLDPAALLRGRIGIALLSARAISVERRPQSAGGTSHRSSIALPVELRRLDLGSIELKPPVLGEEILLSVTGDAALSGGRTAAHLRIHRLDQGPGQIDAQLDLSGKPLRLRVAATIDDPSGKLLDSLLARRDHLPLSLRLSGDAPLADWRGRLAAAAGDAARLDATLAFAESGGGYRVAIDGRAAAAALLPPSLRDAIGNATTFRLSGSEKPNGDIVADALRLDLAAATLDGSAALGGGADGRATAAITVAAPDLGKLSSLLGRPITGAAELRLALSGTKRKPAASADLKAEGLRLAGTSAHEVAAHVTAASTGPLNEPRSRLSFSGGGRIDGIVATALPRANDIKRLTWTLAGSAEPAAKTVEIKNFAVTAPGLTATAQGNADGADATLSGAVHVAASDLSRLSGLAGHALSGHGKLDATVARDASGTAELRATGGFDDLVTGAARLDALLGGRLGIDIAARRAANGDLDVTSMTIDAADLHARGQAAIDSATNRATGRFALDLPHLDALGTKAQPVTGRAHLVGNLSGTATAPRLDAVLDADDVTSSGIRLDRLEARLAASKAPTPEGRLDAQFRSGKLTGEIKGQFAASGDGKALDLPKLSFVAGRTSLTATLHTVLASHLTSGDITARSADLAQLSSLVGLPLAGTMALRTKLTTDHGQEASFSLSAAKLSVGSTPAARATVARITASGRFSDLLGAPAGAAKIALRQATFGTEAIDRLDASIASRRAGRFAFAGALDGKVRAPIELATAGEVEVTKGAIAARITKFGGQLGGQRVELEAPLRLVKSGSDLSVSGLALALGSGKLTGQAALKGEALAAKLAARDMPLALAEAFAGKGAVSGTASADLDLNGSVARPAGRLAVTARGVRLGGAAHAHQPAIDLTAEARLLPGRVALDGRVALPKGEAITMTGEVPIRISPHPFTAALARDRPFALRVMGDGRLEDIADLLPTGDDKLSGHYHLDLRASGTVASPNAAGQVTLDHGRYESLNYGTVLDGMTLDLVGNRDRIDLRFSATDGGKGTLAISGTGLLAAQPAPSLDIKVALRKFQLTHTDEAIAHASSDLRIAGTMTEPHVTGSIRVDDAQLYLPDQLPPSVHKLDVTEIDSTKGEVIKKPPPASSKPPVDAALDVTLDIPGQVFVRGRGLDSEWQGHFHVTGTSSAPQIQGGLQIVHGTMNFLGKTLTLSRGKITLVGSNKIEPMVDFLAESTGTNVTAEVAVTGPAEHPKITLTSNPPLPQDEILAQLLFGRDVTQLTPLEGAQIAAAAAALASGGPSVIDRLRMKTGLDRLSVGSANQTMAGPGSSVPPAGSGSSGAGGVGNTAVSAGKYVAPGVYVGVNQAASGESQAEVEVEVTRHVDVDTTASAQHGNSLGVEWKLDY